MKMVSARLKMLTLKVHIAVSVMTMVLMQMKHGCMGIDFIRLVMVYLAKKVKAKKRSSPENLTQWIITQSKGFSRKGVEKISRSVRIYVD